MLQVPLLLAGCALHQVAPPEPLPFSCTAASVAWTGSPTPGPGTMELELLDAPPPAPPPAPASGWHGPDAEAAAIAHYGPVELSVRLDEAPAGPFGLALGELLGVPVGVAPLLADQRLTLAMPSGSFEELITLLRESSAVYIGFPRGVLTLQDEHSWSRERHPSSTNELQTWVVPIHHADPIEIATAYCATLASAAGRATVSEGQLVIRDSCHHITSARELVQVLDAAAEPQSEE